MFKYTKHFLKKTEDLFAEIEYVIRYERGSFKSGYCIVEDRKIAVINKFFDTEARINTLIEILNVVEIDLSKLTEGAASHYKALMKSVAKRDGEKNSSEETKEEQNPKKEEKEEVVEVIPEAKEEIE